VEATAFNHGKFYHSVKFKKPI